MVHPARLPIDELLADCAVKRTRRSGPGGQHRNKVETAVVITHRPTGVRAEASERRSQADNRREAIFRLRVQLALRVRREVPDCPSKLWRSRTAGRQVAVSKKHDDFPAILAEALDSVYSFQGAVADAAQRLGVTTSQLIKLLKVEPDALTSVNQLRGDHDLAPLR